MKVYLIYYIVLPLFVFGVEIAVPWMLSSQVDSSTSRDIEESLAELAQQISKAKELTHDQSTTGSQEGASKEEEEVPSIKISLDRYNKTVMHAANSFKRFRYEVEKADVL